MALSLDPQNINKESWYYEEKRGINLIHEIRQGGKYLCTKQVLIPWQLIEKSLQRRTAKGERRHQAGKVKRTIPLFKGYKRLNEPVELTAKGREMFPRGSPCGILVRLAGDGRWVVRRDGQQNAYYWHRKWWKKCAATK